MKYYSSFFLLSIIMVQAACQIPFQKAASLLSRKDFKEIVALTKRDDFDPRVKSEQNGWNLLHVAVAKGCAPEIITYLLGAGVIIEMNQVGFPPSGLSNKKEYDFLREIESKAGEIEQIPTFGSFSPKSFFHAAIEGDLFFLYYLRQRKFNPNIYDTDGDTHLEIIEPKGWMPLQYAINENKTLVVAFLLGAGADVKEPPLTKKERTQRKEILQLLKLYQQAIDEIAGTRKKESENNNIIFNE